MGRQWFSWAGGRPSSSAKKRRDSPPRKPPPSYTGCMCAVLQIFDLPPLNPHRSLSSFLQHDDPYEPTPKGVEAPRNSLELEEIMVLKPADVSLKRKGEETKFLNNVSVGIHQIRTSSEFSSSECSSSSPGGARTPNLVARLMGLDLLPENNNNGSSPASTLSSSSRLDRARYLLLHRSGTLSLPETPRMSMTRKSDVDTHHRNRHQDHHHRLSLQISKENIVMGREDEESAKMVNRIVKHLKEGRKFGRDITNTAAGEHCRKDRFVDTSTQVVLLKPNRPSGGKIAANEDFAHAKNHSPRLLSSPKTEDPPVKQPQKTIPKPKRPHEIDIPNKVITNPFKNNRQRKPPPQKEETFVRPTANAAPENKKGIKRATLLSSPNNVPTILPAAMKKDRRPSPVPEKSVQKLEKAVLFVPKSGSDLLSSSPSQTYKSPAATTARGSAPPLELEYIQRVLKRAGIEKETPATSYKWHSYSHPLNPSIFHYMELLHHSTLRRRSDRKLIFHLADELLAGILKSRRGSMTGSELAEALCFKIRELPSRECHVLEDIDALIDGDLKKSDQNEREEEEEEEEGIVGEIERYVAEALVEETAAVVLEVARPYRWRRRREGGFMSQVLTF